MSVRPLRSSSASAAVSGWPTVAPSATRAHSSAHPPRNPKWRANRRRLEGSAVAGLAFLNDDFRALAVPGEIRCCKYVAQGLERLETVDGTLELHLRESSGVDAIAVNRREAGFAMEPCKECGKCRAFELEARRQLGNPLETHVVVGEVAGQRRRGVAMQ